MDWIVQVTVFERRRRDRTVSMQSEGRRFDASSRTPSFLLLLAAVASRILTKARRGAETKSPSRQYLKNVVSSSEGEG